MLRIITIDAALTARGYAADAESDVLIEVTDDVLPENAGLWRLAVSRGSAHVERASATPAGALRLDIRALATLFTGHVSAATLRQRGLLEGPTSAERALEACLPPSGAWLAEAF
jgi:predicted acetyltransferase